MSNEQQQPTETKGAKIPVGAVSIILTLGLLFLKLAGLIDISWWWVLAPVGLAAGASILFVILGLILAVVLSGLMGLAKRGRE